MKINTSKHFSDWYASYPGGEPSYQETFEAGYRAALQQNQVLEKFEQLNSDAADARRYRAIKLRHAYRFVRNMIGEKGYASHKAPGQIDAFADDAVAEVDAWDSLTQEEKDASHKRDLDAAIKQGESK